MRLSVIWRAFSDFRFQPTQTQIAGQRSVYLRLLAHLAIQIVGFLTAQLSFLTFCAGASCAETSWPLWCLRGLCKASTWPNRQTNYKWLRGRILGVVTLIGSGERQCRTNCEIGKQYHRYGILIKVVRICQPVGRGFTPQRSILFQHQDCRSNLSIIAPASW